MILSDREIEMALDRGAVEIIPDPRGNTSLWSSTSIDLRLESELIFWNPPAPDSSFEFQPPDEPGFSLDDLIKSHSHSVLIPDEGWLLKPGQFCLGWTIERVKIPEPSRIAARVEGKSSLARLGLGVHVTAPTIHAGFGFKRANPTAPGLTIQLEIWHVGQYPIRLKKGMKVCQLIFEEVHGTPTKGYLGRFANQGPQSG